VGGLTESIELVEACRRICEWSGAAWMIENPVSTLGSYWRQPEFTFHPREFGGYQGGEDDDYNKRTCVWTGGGFRSPQKRPIPEFRPPYIDNMPPSDERGDLRSVTPPGFACAVFEANVEDTRPVESPDLRFPAAKFHPSEGSAVDDTAALDPVRLFI
jgi:hypothetical protein